MPVGTPPMYVLHLFSGAGRPDDFQHAFEAIIGVSEAPIVVLSVDIANSPRGDLTDEAVIDFWSRLFVEGKVAAVAAGPPCETWSIARLRELQGQHSPQPLRSPNLPWGLPTLSAREYAQLAAANAQYRVALRFMYMCYSFHISGFLEHPRRLSRPGAPSS